MKHYKPPCSNFDSNKTTTITPIQSSSGRQRVASHQAVCEGLQAPAKFPTACKGVLVFASFTPRNIPTCRSTNIPGVKTMISGEVRKVPYIIHRQSPLLFLGCDAYETWIYIECIVIANKRHCILQSLRPIGTHRKAYPPHEHNP